MNEVKQDIKSFNKLTKEERNILRYYRIKHKENSKLLQVLSLLLLIIWFLVICAQSEVLILAVGLPLLAIMSLVNYFDEKNYYSKHPESINALNEYKEAQEETNNKYKKIMPLMIVTLLFFMVAVVFLLYSHFKLAIGFFIGGLIVYFIYLVLCARNIKK